MRGPDSAPKRRGNAGRLLAHVVHAHVLEPVGRLGGAFDGVDVESLDVREEHVQTGGAHHPQVLGKELTDHAAQDRGSDDLMRPGHRSTVLVQAGGDAVVVVGPVHVVLNIFFPGPHHLHGARDLLRDLDRARHEIHFQPPPEPPSQQVVVHPHLVAGQPGELRGRRLREGGHLGSEPEIAAVGAHVDRAVHGLHRGMSQERHLVHGFHTAGRALHGGRGVAVRARDHPGARGCGLELV